MNLTDIYSPSKKINVPQSISSNQLMYSTEKRLCQSDNNGQTEQKQYDTKDYIRTAIKNDAYEYYYKIYSVFSIIYRLLGYNNDEVLKIGERILWECVTHGKQDIQISRTGENELLIFRNVRGTFNNIIIDEDGDIEFMSIPPDRSNAYNIYYPLDENPNIGKIVNNL